MKKLLFTTSYSIISYNTEKVGLKSLDPECIHEWSSSPKNKFELWQHHRLWLVDKLQGTAHVKTTFGEFDLEEHKCYFIPAATLIETSINGVMIQTHLEFLINSLSFDFTRFTLFNPISENFITVKTLLKNFITIGNYVQPITNESNSVLAIILSFFNIVPSKQSTDPFFIKVLTYIEENVTTKCSTKDLALHFGYTTSFFCTKFKDIFKMSPQQFILEKKIDYSKILLLTTNKTINEISKICGFSDPLYFSRVFKKRTRFSPTTFKSTFMKVRNSSRGTKNNKLT